MQSIAASQANKAMSTALQREMERQQGYRNQAFGTFQTGVQPRGVETAREQIGQGAENRQNFYQHVGQAPLAVNAPTLPRAQEYYGLTGQNRARLGGYSDWAINQMISNIRTQDELNRLSNFAQGTAQVFPYRMYDAQHSADELAFWGSLIASLGGGAGSFLGGSGGSQPPLGFGGRSSPANGGFGVPEGFGSQFAGYS